MSEEKEFLLGFLISSISILRDMNIQFTEKSRNKLSDKIMELLTSYDKQQKEIEELKEENRKKSIVIIEYQDLYEKLEDKIKAKMKEKEWSLENYDCDESDYKQSQAIGAWSVLQSLLEKE